jgi:hypothetical protein
LKTTIIGSCYRDKIVIENIGNISYKFLIETQDNDLFNENDNDNINMNELIISDFYK